MKNLKRKQIGFTLIELLLVIGVISAASGVAVYFLGKKAQFTKAVMQVKMVTALDKSIQNYASVINNSTNLSTLNSDNIIKANLVPTENILNNKLVTSYGGDMTITGQMAGTTPAYKLTMEALPSTACVTMGNQLGFDSLGVLVNGVTVRALNSTAEINVATLASACSQTDNTVELVRAILKNNSTVVNNSDGNNGNSDSLLVADLHKTAIGAACPANSIATGFGCGCAEGNIWNGVACAPISAKNRLDGVTLGESVPVVSASMNDLATNNTIGTPSDFNSPLSKYLPHYMASMPAVEPGKEGFIITEKSPNSIANTAYCTNGQVLQQTVSAGVITSRNCVTPTFNYEEAGVAKTQNITAVDDTNKFKHCLLGEINDKRCQMPTDTKTNVPPTVWQSTVAAPNSAGARCTNGQIWNPGTQTCACTGGTTLNTKGFCSCTDTQRFDAATGTCVAK